MHSMENGLKKKKVLVRNLYLGVDIKQISCDANRRLGEAAAVIAGGRMRKVGRFLFL